MTINSNNFLLNEGSISNQNTASAIGIAVDTSAGNIVNSTGIANLGGINLTGNGTGKSALLIEGGNTFFAPITFSAVTSTVGSSTTLSGSSVSVVGDGSNIFTLFQGTTIDGDVNMARHHEPGGQRQIHHRGQHRLRYRRQSQAAISSSASSRL